MNRRAALDPDYGVFVAGPPRRVRSWFRGAFVEVVACDIGRAPQPGYVGMGDGDACEQVEKMPPGKPPPKRKVLPLDERMRRHIRSHWGSMQLKNLAAYVRMPVADLWSYLAERPETYTLTGQLGKRRPAPRVTLKITNFQEDHK